AGTAIVGSIVTTPLSTVIGPVPFHVADHVARVVTSCHAPPLVVSFARNPSGLNVQSFASPAVGVTAMAGGLLPPRLTTVTSLPVTQLLAVASHRPATAPTTTFT